MKSAITVSLVEEARGGPFVFWDGLEDACRQASELGFDAIEVFAPGPHAVDHDRLQSHLDEHGLAVAAVGTGAGMVKHGLSLCHADQSHRQRAIDFVQQMIDFGAKYQAPAIIGSMQGRWGDGTDRDTAIGHLRDALNQLGRHASGRQVPLIYEPLNRYETNLFTRIGESAAFVETLETDRVQLLADLFHMNIEESNLADSIRAGGRHIGHIHFVDSNRQAAGLGHTDFGPIIAALREIGYEGYLCAEAFPLPDSRTAAEETIRAYRRLVGIGEPA